MSTHRFLFGRDGLKPERRIATASMCLVLALAGASLLLGTNPGASVPSAPSRESPQTKACRARSERPQQFRIGLPGLVAGRQKRSPRQTISV
jgi:hypothetical protein